VGLAFAKALAAAGADVAGFDIIPPSEGFLNIEKQYGVKSKHYMSVISGIFGW